MKTSQQQTSDLGAERLTSLQEDSLANLLAQQGSDAERMITVTSGRKCLEPLEKSSPLGLLVKTLLESSAWYSPARRLKWEVSNLSSEKVTVRQYSDNNSSQKPSVKTLSEKATPSNRLLFRLVPSEHPTAETGCGLLPTVQTQGLKVCNAEGKTEFMSMDLLPTPTAQDFKRRGPNSQQQGLPELVYRMSMDLLPTPRANKVNGCDLHNPNIANRNKGNLEEAVAQMIMLPTPNASEAEKYTKTYNPNSQMGRGLTAMAANGMIRPFGEAIRDAIMELPEQYQPNHGKSSQLNPLFVAEMMGFPLMWTVLPYLSESGDPNQSKDTATP